MSRSGDVMDPMFWTCLFEERRGIEKETKESLYILDSFPGTNKQSLDAAFTVTHGDCSLFVVTHGLWP